MHSISLPTSYGPAAYHFTLSPTGKVSQVKCSSLDLPDAVLKLTYPNVHPEDLRQHLEDWLPVIPYLIELGVWLKEPPEYLAGVQQTFSANTTNYEQLRETVLQADPLEETPEHRHWQHVSAWIKIGVSRKVVRFPLLLTRKDTVFSAEKLSLPYRRLSAAWLLITFPLAPPLRIDEWIVAIGKTRTTEGNDFLLRELERPGYLTYAKQVYSTLANSRLRLPVERILALYEDQDKVSHSVSTYVHLINQFPFPAVRDILERIIGDYPRESFGAIKRLYKQDPSFAQHIIKERFQTVDDYGIVITMLRHMIKLVKPGNYFISLREINKRLTAPVFLDNTQVTWPQKLDDGWRVVLLCTNPKEVKEVLSAFFADSSGRIARNVLLQLKEYLLAYHQEVHLSLSPAVETHLFSLLNSRFDKVSTVATDVIRLLLPNLQQKEPAVRALLAHLEVSKYRMMDAAALKVAANDPSLLELQKAHFQKRIAEATTDDERSKLIKVLTYVRFLPPLEELSDK